jgi:hypothetical protein
MTSTEEGLHEKLINHSELKVKRSIISQRSEASQPDPTYNNTPGFAAQSRLLIYKNVILTFRNPKNLVFLIITPFLLSLFLYVFQGLARENGQRTKIDTEVLPLDGFTRCYGQDCVSLHYRVISNSPDFATPKWVDYTLNYIKLETGFGDNDITTGPNFVNVDDLQTYYENTQKNRNKTQIALYFCG